MDDTDRHVARMIETMHGKSFQSEKPLRKRNDLGYPDVDSRIIGY